MWTKFWAPGTPDEEEVEHDNIHTLLTGLRQHALLEPPDPPVTPSCYNSALKVYRNDTKGSDNWTSSELKALPDHSKSELSNALNNAHLNIAQPHQHLIGLHSCLGKPSNDIRTICKTPMLYRMMCRIDRSIKNWEKLHAQSYDSANAGSSAARSALFRNLSSEIAMWLGKPSAAVFNDYHKFFDTIDIPTLVSQAIHTQSPMRELAFAIQQHLAPRVIQVSGFCSKPTKVYKSILPGCKHAVAFTRTLLMNLMTSIVSSHEDVDTHVHVDDTAMFVSADTQSEVQDLIAPCISDFADGVRRLKLSLSSKGVISTSHDKMSNRIRDDFRSFGVKYQVQPQARDLGFSYTSARSNPNKTIKHRLKKSKARLVTNHALTKISLNARVFSLVLLSQQPPSGMQHVASHNSNWKNWRLPLQIALGSPNQGVVALSRFCLLSDVTAHRMRGSFMKRFLNGFTHYANTCVKVITSTLLQHGLQLARK